MSKDKFARQPNIKMTLQGRAKLLDSWGGRNEYDVMRDENGEYVVMTDGYKDVRVYLPEKV